MKAVTEFPNFTLSQALKSKTAMAAEGKTPEEIQQSLGETYKLEGEKLTHFVNSLEVAGQHTDGLKRVLVMTLSEGENVPAKAAKVEEHYYVPEFYAPMNAQQPKKSDGKGGRQNNRGGGGGRGRSEQPKGSPWGLTPEEKAAKSGKGAGKPAKA
jgi:hypothetical protein